MFWSRQPARPRAVLRARLGLESLDGRAVPSGLFGDGEPPLLISRFGDESITIAPRIINFTAVEVETGWYRFTGQVVDSTTVGGLTIDFDGVPSLDNETTTTAADGTFSHTVPVRTDGSDSGEVRAKTTADGVTSAEVAVNISPTP